MELAEQAEKLRAQGYGLVSVVPEPPEVLKAFAVRQHLNYPLLSDVGSRVIRQYGLVDPNFKGGEDKKEIPYAGTFVADAQLVVRSKDFEAEEPLRRTGGSVLARLGGDAAGGAETAQDHFVLRTSASNTVVRPGQTFTLALRFRLEEKHHFYAPGEHSYRALDLKLTPREGLRFAPLQRPASTPYHFAPLKETVPVYEGEVELLQDVTVGLETLKALKDVESLPLQVAGTLEYQVCSDRVCYPPRRLPLSWSLTLARWVK